MNPDTRVDVGSAASTDGDRARERKFHQAAVAYFAYGMLYFTRIFALGLRSDWNLHGYPKSAALVALPVGLIITVVFPYFIWRSVRWFTMALAIVVFLRAVYLFSQSNVDFFMGPFFVTAVAAWMLARAAWDL